MSTTRAISDYSRQELYDLIWSTSARRLATDFGISDVAIAKRCKRLNVPRPSRGYWAKIAAGKTLRKLPLPPTPDEIFKQNAQRRVPQSLPLPAAPEPLHPLASELVNVMTKAKVGLDERVEISEPSFPEVTVSKASASRAAQAFHAILKAVEALGICFHKPQSIYTSGFFKRQGGRSYLTIEEDFVGSLKASHSWYEPSRGGKPSGHLTFSIRPHRWRRDEAQKWSESKALPLPKLLSQLVSAMLKHFADQAEWRKQSAIREAQWKVEREKREQEEKRQEPIRAQQKKEREHAEAIAKTVAERKTAVLEAADNWRLSCVLLEFVDACEGRRKNQSLALSPEQTAWLTWARGIAETISPFSVG